MRLQSRRRRRRLAIGFALLWSRAKRFLQTCLLLLLLLLLMLFLLPRRLSVRERVRRKVKSVASRRVVVARGSSVVLLLRRRRPAARATLSVSSIPRPLGAFKVVLFLFGKFRLGGCFRPSLRRLLSSERFTIFRPPLEQENQGFKYFLVEHFLLFRHVLRLIRVELSLRSFVPRLDGCTIDTNLLFHRQRQKGV